MAVRTAAARRAVEIRDRLGVDVVPTRRLADSDVSTQEIRGQLAGGRWRRLRTAIVLHNGTLTLGQRRAVCLVNAGPRALLTSFTALERYGLTGWRRDAVHILVPAGARVRELPGLPVVVHRTASWSGTRRHKVQPLHAAPEAAARAAASFTRSRPACGLLAAVVQQRLLGSARLPAEIEATPNLRHRSALLAALDDIAMGAEALSEIDFAVLCRRARIMEPLQQAVRRDPQGRRRYLDAEWRAPDGSRVVAEVDGGLHLQVIGWWEDQLRQNEVTLSRSMVLRFPSVVVRAQDPVVADQLRRAGLGL